MKRYDVITLIQEIPKIRGVFDEKDNEIKREVMVEVRSVGMSSFYESYNSGFKPTYVFVIAQPDEYANEKKVIFKDNKYKVIRTYINKGDSVELTVEPDTDD